MKSPKRIVVLAALGMSLALAFSVYYRESPINVAGQKSSFEGSRARLRPTADIGGNDGKVSKALVTANADYSRLDRQRDFYSATNLFPFVKQAAADAIKHHDGRAAYYVSEALKSCTLVFQQIQQNPAFESNFDLEYAKFAPKAPEWARLKARRNFDRCVQLATADPFVDLPLRPDGYRKPKFWEDIAMAENDPLAEAQRAYVDVIGGTFANSEERIAKLQQAQKFINDVAKSGDPTALFLTGQLLSNSRSTSDPLKGVAISLAACDLGYDCSANNPANSFYTCKETGGCPADADYSYYMQATLGPRDFATAFSDAQNFKELLVRKDWEEINNFLKLDGAIARND